MKIQCDNYTIDVSEVALSEIGEHSDYIKHLSPNGYYQVLRIHVSEQSNIVSKAVIGSEGVVIAPNNKSIIYHNNQLIACIGSDICCLNIPSLEKIWVTKCDEACCFTIHEYNNGYVIHGELCITYIDLYGNAIWEFSARDIFVTDKDYEYSFKIENEIIHVIDWLGYEYHIDKLGNCVKETKH